MTQDQKVRRPVMNAKRYLHFDTIEEFREGKNIGLGIVLINDFSKRSEFMFHDWRIPIIRPNSPDCSKYLSSFLNDPGLISSAKSGYADELLSYVTEKLNREDESVQDSFFMAVSFDSGTPKNDLNFSSAANLKLLEAIEKNFSSSGQTIGCSVSPSNVEA
jgi:hypothetical protein